jgi:hypothetical protein
VELNVQKRREDTPKNGGGEKVEKKKNYMFKSVTCIFPQKEKP